VAGRGAFGPRARAAVSVRAVGPGRACACSVHVLPHGRDVVSSRVLNILRSVACPRGLGCRVAAFVVLVEGRWSLWIPACAGMTGWGRLRCSPVGASLRASWSRWIPAFAGMTVWVRVSWSMCRRFVVGFPKSLDTRVRGGDGWARVSWLRCRRFVVGFSKSLDPRVRGDDGCGKVLWSMCRRCPAG